MREVKICGIKRPEDVRIINNELPDYCGFIVDFPKSRRSVSEKTLRELSGAVDKRIKKAGVFVDKAPEFIAGLLNEGVIDIAQLHGHEDNDYIEELQDLTDEPIWQAFQIHGKQDIEKAAESLADLVLLDSGQGLGKTFDWGLIKDFPGPFALAGGLNTENIEEALKTDALLFDVSGGVETDGVKDAAKVREFIRRVRSDRDPSLRSG